MRGTDCGKYLINTAVNTALAVPGRPRRGTVLLSCGKFCQGRREKMREGRENAADFAPCFATTLGGPQGARGGWDSDTVRMSPEQEGFTISAQMSGEAP